jgi:hypothetical protein
MLLLPRLGTRYQTDKAEPPEDRAILVKFYSLSLMLIAGRVVRPTSVVTTWFDSNAIDFMAFFERDD